jgi:hypothetical protein
MKTIKILLIAVLFIGAYSASAQWTTVGTNTTTTNFVGVGYTTTPDATFNIGLAVNKDFYAFGRGFFGGNLKPFSATQRWDFGWGPMKGANVEFYSLTHAVSPGQMRFIFGAPGVGNINYKHYNGSSYDSYLFINHNGNVGIGTETPSSKLSVNGVISCTSLASTGAVSCTNISANGKITTKEVEVTLSGWPDYVFNEDYKLTPLSDVETFIKENKHLPGIKSAKELEENGVSLGEMNKQLMQKVEELTLYVIRLQKEVDALK